MYAGHLQCLLTYDSLLDEASLLNAWNGSPVQLMEVLTEMQWVTLLALAS